MKHVLFDMDATLANINHRLHHIRNNDGERRHDADWDSFNEEMHKDVPNANIVVLAILMQLCGKNIQIITGRPEKYRKKTEDWLKKHDIKYDKLLMRPDDDERSDYLVKEELFHTHFDVRDILFVVEDRDRVVQMWRDIGLTCLQCQKGDY